MDIPYEHVPGSCGISKGLTNPQIEAHEIGLRLALGATKVMILRMVIREGAVLAAAGMVLGVLGAIAATRLLGMMLFQVQPYDPLTCAGGLVLLSVVTFVACYIPASRAARIDPLAALRID